MPLYDVRLFEERGPTREHDREIGPFQLSAATEAEALTLAWAQVRLQFPEVNPMKLWAHRIWKMAD